MALSLEMAATEDKTAECDSKIQKGIKRVGLQVTAEMQSAISFLQKGSTLTKVLSVGRRYQRYYYVDTASLILAYSKSGKCWKKPGGSKIPIKFIQEIREDHHSLFHKEEHVPSFTVVIGEQMKTLTLIAPNADVKDMWVLGLRFLVKARSVNDQARQEQMWLEEHFSHADKNRDGVLDKREMVRLLQSLNASSEIVSYVKECECRQKLNAEEFVALYKEISSRKELEELFNKYAGDHVSMNASELSEFFSVEEHQTFSKDEIDDIIGRSEPCPDLKAQNRLSLVGFSNMFFLPVMNIKQMKCRAVYQDMTQPLNHYFINSSHNTYLEAHQLYGKSSAQQYDRVLTHRCRCVELDVWNGVKGEPIIYHGYTRTTKILFKDALKAIKKRGFKKSDYPVILSIENHCSVKQQVRMAELLNKVFGDKLLVEPLPEDSVNLPSPVQLKGRVIVKGKKLPADTDDGELVESDSDEAAEIEEEEVQKRVKKYKKKGLTLARELSDCIVICQIMPFKSFEESRRVGTFVNMSSFSEVKALSLTNKDGGRAFVQHNTHQLSRIYPASGRIDSSNFDPIPMWMAGCQMVALNFQTRDDPLMLNYGFFEDNGACGYVLKPEFMRSTSSEFGQYAPDPSWTQILTIRVISGYKLPNKLGDSDRNNIDPYVRVEIHGVPADKQKDDTSVVRANGFNPVWNQTMKFTVMCPQLALVLFRVLDDIKLSKDPTIAQYCLPMSCVQTGYRMIELRDMRGERLGPTGLFVHITIDKSPA